MSQGEEAPSRRAGNDTRSARRKLKGRIVVVNEEDSMGGWRGMIRQSEMGGNSVGGPSCEVPFLHDRCEEHLVSWKWRKKGAEGIPKAELLSFL